MITPGIRMLWWFAAWLYAGAVLGVILKEVL